MGTQPNTSFVMTASEQHFVASHYDGSKSAAIHAGLQTLMEAAMDIRIGIDMDGFWSDDADPATIDEATAAEYWTLFVSRLTARLRSEYPGVSVAIRQGVSNPTYGTEIAIEWPVADGEGMTEYNDHLAWIQGAVEEVWASIW